MKNYKIIIFLIVCLLLFSYSNILASEKGDKWILKFGFVGSTAQLYGQACVKLSEWVEERSEGRLKIEIFPGGQLGNERDLPEGVKMGSVDMALIGASTLGMWQPDFHILGVAFIWKDFDHLLEVVRGPIGQEMIDKLNKETGIKIIDMGWIEGARQFNTSTKPIRTPDDMVGVKMRVPEVPIYLSNMKAMGANAVAMNWGEVFTSVQTGVIDGQENPLDVIYENRFHEIAKYISLSSHVIQNQSILINNNKFNALPEDLQEILVETTIEAGDWLTHQKVESFDYYYNKLIEEGAIIVEDVDRDAFREKCKDTILDEWGDQWTEGLYEEIEKAANTN